MSKQVIEIAAMMTADHDQNVADHAEKKVAATKPAPKVEAKPQTSHQAKEPSKKTAPKKAVKAVKASHFSPGQLAEFNDVITPLLDKIKDQEALGERLATVQKSASVMHAEVIDLTALAGQLRDELDNALSALETAQKERIALDEGLSEVEEKVSAFSLTVGRVERFMESVVPRRMTGDDLARGLGRFLIPQA